MVGHMRVKIRKIRTHKKTKATFGRLELQKMPWQQLLIFWNNIIGTFGNAGASWGDLQPAMGTSTPV
jgi:hypothetical protein